MIKKLQNKGTGKIGYLYIANKDVNYQVLDENDCVLGVYDTLPRLSKEWEDYEEPKQCWYITLTGEVREGILDADWRDERRIGNYFETKEEAEKAVEKLKAWKRLKDKGFKFKGWNTAFCEIDFDVPDSFYPINGNMITNETEEDLDLLFGDEK